MVEGEDDAFSIEAGNGEGREAFEAELADGASDMLGKGRTFPGQGVVKGEIEDRLSILPSLIGGACDSGGHRVGGNSDGVEPAGLAV